MGMIHTFCMIIRFIFPYNIKNTHLFFLSSLNFNLCTFIQVRDIKEELGGLGPRMEDMRGVSRQLQTQLKKFPECSETSFEGEADTLMDSWLDVSVMLLPLNEMHRSIN